MTENCFLEVLPKWQLIWDALKYWFTTREPQQLQGDLKIQFNSNVFV